MSRSAVALGLATSIMLVAPTLVGAAAAPAAPETVRFFQETEQNLMDAVAAGDKAVWERVLDDSCVHTSEEGEVNTKAQLLEQLRPLPPGLTGSITVEELTVQEAGPTAIVRFLANESESVFGQQLHVLYRTTDVFKRDGAAWKLVASHTSVVTKDPPAEKVPTESWPALAGKYRLLPDGWTFTVELREGKLYGGRDPQRMRPLIALTPTAFVASGSLGEWLFVVENGKATRILNLRKFATLVWTRVE